MKNITLISRILISALFLLSAVAKLYPTPLYGITKVFEEGQLIPMGFSSDFAPFLSRLIIGFEFFIAFAILQSHYIKKLVIPSTILLLSVFCIDLAIDIFGGVDENCGCFGQLIPMTPMEAFIKNIFTILLLLFIYRNVTDREKSSFLLLFNGYLIISVLMFSLLPIATNSSNKQVSSFSSYVDSDFDINNGKKILCFFDAGCDHCMDAAKSLTELSTNNNSFPDIHIIFSDTEEDKIPEFLNYAGSEFSYQVMEFYNPDDEINSYLEVLGFEYENPVVIYYNNGNQMRFFDGTGSNEYNSDDFKSL
ncbi:MAG: MauE/DoxX family redox-associated membrane protein, partial [Flavobacteriales bacterium]